MSDKITLPDLPPPGADTGHWRAWLSVVLGTEKVPVVGAYALSTDDVDQAAIVVRLADKTELLFRPARTLISRKLTDAFTLRGCVVPNYGVAQLVVIGRAFGHLASEAAESEYAETSAEFGALGAEWLERCRLRATVVELEHRDGIATRAAIEAVRTIAARGDDRTVPPLIFDHDRGTWLVWSAPFRRFVRERRGPSAEDLISVQMQRCEWHPQRLIARQGPGRVGTVELPVWVVYNGWQGIEYEKVPISSDFQQKFKDA